MRKKALQGLFGSLLVLFSWLAYRSDSSHQENVILIVLDTLRADHLSGYGYVQKTTPILDRFARENFWFKNVISAAPWTAPSVASIFTGLYPSSHGVLSHSDEEGEILASSVLWEGFELLAESFSRNGYSTIGVTANPWVSDHLGFSQGFDIFTSPPWYSATALNQAVFPLITKLSKEQDPFFLYLHYFDPHEPYNPPEGFQGYFVDQMYPDHYSKKTRGELKKYDAEIRSLDAALGHLFLELKRLELWENTSIVIVGDHGEQFNEYGRMGHGYTVFPEETNVPLLIKTQKRVGRSDVPVSTLDVYATILDIANISSPHLRQRNSLFSKLKSDEEGGIFSEGTLEGNHKAFVAPDGSRLVLTFSKASGEQVSSSDQIDAKLYSADNVLISAVAPDAIRLRDKLQSQFYLTYNQAIKLRPEAAGRSVPLQEKVVSELRSLGYLE